MKHIRKTMGIVFGILLLTVFVVPAGATTFELAENVGVQVGDTWSYVTTQGSYESHDPIVIASNADFEIQGWPGNGTQETPYVIENLWIMRVVENARCIEIKGTTAFFIIRGCLITTTVSDGYGISFWDVQHGLVENNTVVGHEFGIRSEFSGGMVFIIGNEVSGSTVGIMSYSTSTNLSADIRNNTVYGNCTGIHVSGVVTVYNNTVVGGIWGILTYPTFSSVISNNTCLNNTYGVTLHLATNDTLVENNVLIGSGMYGIELTSTTGNNTVTWNYIESEYQARDDGVQNLFSYNYWSNYYGYDLDNDGFGDTPYIVHGGAGSVDNYPRGPMRTSLLLDDWHGAIWFNESLCQLSAIFVVDCQYYVYTPSIIHTDLISTFTGEKGNISAGESSVIIHVGERFWGTSVYFNTTHGSIESLWLPDVLVSYGVSGRAPVETGRTIELSMRFDCRTYWAFAIDGAIRESGIVNDSRWSQEYLTFVFDKDLTAGEHSWSFNCTHNPAYPYNWDLRAGIYTNVPPEIDDVLDIGYEFGTLGHTITWSPFDEYPDSYEVYRNGTLIESGIWDGSSIAINVDGLEIGLYNYTVFVNNTLGLFASNSVFVTVVAGTTTTPTTTTTDDPTTNGADIPTALIVVGGIIIAIVVIIVLSKRKTH